MLRMLRENEEAVPNRQSGPTKTVRSPAPPVDHVRPGTAHLLLPVPSMRSWIQPRASAPRQLLTISLPSEERQAPRGTAAIPFVGEPERPDDAPGGVIASPETRRNRTDPSRWRSAMWGEGVVAEGEGSTCQLTPTPALWW